MLVINAVNGYNVNTLQGILIKTLKESVYKCVIANNQLCPAWAYMLFLPFHLKVLA